MHNVERKVVNCRITLWTINPLSRFSEAVGVEVAVIEESVVHSPSRNHAAPGPVSVGRRSSSVIMIFGVYL